MHPAAYTFVAQHRPKKYQRVLEVGSYNVNGSVRGIFPDAKTYLGIDVRPGPGVDRVHDLSKDDLGERFDTIVCCEVLEHCARWRELIAAMRRHLEPGGRLLITCGGPGRKPHGVDGGAVGDEYYANVSVTVLGAELAGMKHTLVTINGNDTQAVANQPRILAITPTRDRPVAMQACTQWVMRQTIPVDRWLIVTDGAGPLPHGPRIDQIHRLSDPGEPPHTLPLNLLRALEHAEAYEHDVLAIFEDDDWYAPNYLDVACRSIFGWGDCRAWGECIEWVYRLPHRNRPGQYLRANNWQHASLHATVLREDAFHLIKVVTEMHVASGRPTIDLSLWANLREGDHALVAAKDKPVSVAMKWPEYPGYAFHHHNPRHLWTDDRDARILKGLIGQDESAIMEYLAAGTPTFDPCPHWQTSPASSPDSAPAEASHPSASPASSAAASERTDSAAPSA